MLLLSLACRGDAVDSTPPESVPLSESGESGHTGDTGGPDEAEIFSSSAEGYGFALALDGQAVLVGAPWAGEVHLLEGGLHSSEGHGYGYSLAVGDEVRIGDALSGPAVIRWFEGWLESDGAGALFHGEAVNLPERPADLAIWGDRRVAGLARGEAALMIDGVVIERPEDFDGAGYSLCVADVDSDGSEELIVGAPNAGRVHVLESDDFEDALTFEAEGRFGHALACSEGRLAVGAPMQSAVFVYDDLEPRPLLTAEVDQLGASLLFVGEDLYAGAPGSNAVVRFR